MATSPELPPRAAADIVQSLTRLTDATRHSAVATLAAAIISARGRPISVEEALEIAHTVRLAMFPASAGGMAEEWKRTKAERLARVWD
jgi:hypothetical protein